ncbi:MAG: 30S ribosomal protein S8 [Candidatus Portnoybacteria bacterium CG23_combo_of_CG06-09_8_20_14_all_37_13]|uniref:Small ribosomal subunit protein uS8 n=1 Tax=Candidatus Portnoybacteria bacterium CG23_combo_of_CG06-09_8_20_14_all_37_13 TaxID=1974819 RepID=A0A2G9YDV1_9BACT|nr:MAG: 30S ribosomal protein S8 [Candidatus Portnoybacteria bacterium CG23_combo_of_CG06-09_8_20_14_all_37_13]
MMLTDPIADMLIRIKNALASQKTEVEMPLSKFKLALAKLLKKKGYFEKIKKRDKILKIILKPEVMSDLKRISKPGCRAYLQKDQIKLNKHKFAIISTSKGLLIDIDAKKQGLGGEVICEIYV